jgi:hypothetical protein
LAIFFCHGDFLLGLCDLFLCRLLSFRPVTDCSDGLLSALSGTGVRFGALSVDGQVPAMPDAPVGVDGNKTPDVLCDLAAQVTLDGVLILKNLEDGRDVGFGQVASLGRGIDLSLLADFIRNVRTYTIDVAERNIDALVVGNVNT